MHALVAVYQLGDIHVARHAGVNEASVAVEVRKNMLWLRIKDNGTGFNIRQAQENRSSGLSGRVDIGRRCVVRVDT